MDANDVVGETLGSGTSTTSGSNNLLMAQSGVAGGILSTADPLLTPLDNYGGPTPTCGLLSGSPAIGSGATVALATDQRGFPVATPPDMGACQDTVKVTHKFITVTTLADQLRAGNGLVSLRDAIQASETQTSVDGSVVGTGYDVIQFAPGLTGIIDLSLVCDDDNSFGPSAFLINDNLTIQGPPCGDHDPACPRRRRRSVSSTSPSAPA